MAIAGKEKNMKKRIVTIALILCMILPTMLINSYAEDNPAEVVICEGEYENDISADLGIMAAEAEDKAETQTETPKKDRFAIPKHYQELAIKIIVTSFFVALGVRFLLFLMGIT